MTHEDDVVPSHEELVRRARALQPALRERRAKGDALRMLPPETVADLQAAGFFRVLQPRRWGGFEHDPQVFFDVQMTIAEACASTAWVLGVVAAHAWQLALFPEQAQADVWGKDSSTLVSSSYAPTGKIERVPGGYRVSGRWSFSSGCDHCQWVFLGGMVPPESEGKPPEMRTFLLPRAEYRIDDNWHTVGLKATGSKDVVVDGTFVPEHRTHRLVDGYFTNSPGNPVNPAPLFKLPFGQLFVRSVSTTAIGVAQAALGIFRDVASKRVGAADGKSVGEDPTTQRVCADAASLIDEAKLVLRRNFDDMMQRVRAGQEIPVDVRVAYRYDSSRAVEKCVEAVDLLFTASGGRAIFLDSPILACFLDVHCARAHYANNPDKPGRNFGGVLLSRKNVDFFL